jgi:hypothetical protein
MMIARSLMLAGASLAMTTTAIAAPLSATVTATGANVTASQDGKLSAIKTANLKLGDRVVAGAKSGAKITYSDGCVVTLPANAMATIGKASPCSGGAGLVTAAGSTPAIAGLEGPAGFAALAFGAVAVIAVVDGAMNDSNDDGPQSP